MLLRRLVLSFLVVLSSAATTWAQAGEAAIAAIRAEYQRIVSSRATYKTRSVNLEGESVEGGEGTAYYEGKSLRLLEVAYYGEIGKLEAQYYYKNGQLIFVLSSRHRYNRPFYYDKKAAKESGDTEAFDPKKSEITEDRYYFQNSKLIRWLDHTKKQQPVAAASHYEEYRNMLSNEASVRAKLRK